MGNTLDVTMTSEMDRMKRSFTCTADVHFYKKVVKKHRQKSDKFINRITMPCINHEVEKNTN